MRRRWIAALVLTVAVVGLEAQTRQFGPEVTAALAALGYVVDTSTFVQYSKNLLYPSAGYINFGTTSGTAGYGFRASAGHIQTKNSGGSWQDVNGFPSTATFLLQTANGSLPNAQAMGALGTGLVSNTTTTGVQSIYAGTSCSGQFPRSLSGAGVATCEQVDLAADVSGLLPTANGGLGTQYLAFTGPASSLKTFTLPNASAMILTSNDVVTLAEGGTGATLTASNGGIFYSTGSAGAILSGTATANQVLLSGSSTAPKFSTSTYPDTISASRLLYASSANTIAGLATANNSTLVTDGSGVPSLATTLPTAVQDNITRLGTIASGVWNGTRLTTTYLPSVSTATLFGRNTAGTGNLESITTTQALDFIGSTRGSVLYRGASGWALLTPGSDGTVLTAHGSGADPNFTSVAGTGDFVGPGSSVNHNLVGFANTSGKLGEDSLVKGVYPTWSSMTLMGDWAIWSGALNTPSYRLDPWSKIVYLKGSLYNTTGSLGPTAPIAVLPSGYRPTKTWIFMIGQPGLGGTVDVRVDSTGNVWIDEITNTTNYLISIDGLAFSVD